MSRTRRSSSCVSSGKCLQRLGARRRFRSTCGSSLHHRDLEKAMQEQQFHESVLPASVVVITLPPLLSAVRTFRLGALLSQWFGGNAERRPQPEAIAFWRTPRRKCPNWKMPCESAVVGARIQHRIEEVRQVSSAPFRTLPALRPSAAMLPSCYRRQPRGTGNLRRSFETADRELFAGHQAGAGQPGQCRAWLGVCV